MKRIVPEEQLIWACEQARLGVSKAKIAQDMKISYKVLTRKMIEAKHFEWLEYGRELTTGLAYEKMRATSIANQLYYSEAVKERIKNATSKSEIQNALIQGRHEL